MKIINVEISLIFFDVVVWLKWMEFSSIQTEQHFTPRIQTWLYLKIFHLVQLLPGRFDPISMFVEVAFLSIQTEQQLTPRIQTWLYLKVSHHFQLLPVRFDLIWRFRIPSRPNEVDALVIFGRCRRHYRLHVKFQLFSRFMFPNYLNAFQPFKGPLELNTNDCFHFGAV